MAHLLLARFLETYYRHRWLYLLPIILMMGLATIYVTTSSPKYVARGILYVQKQSFLASLNSVRNNDSSWWVTPSQQVISEFNELLRTDAFVRAVIHKTDLENEMLVGYPQIQETINKTRESVWLTSLGDSQLQINVSFEDPTIAVQIVNSLIENYIQWQVNIQRTESEAAQAFFAEQLTIYETNLEMAREQMKIYLQDHPIPLRGDRPEIEKLEVARLQKDMDLAQTRYMNTLDKEENARLALAQIESDTRQSYSIIDAPRLPDKPEVSRKEMAIQVGVFVAVGLILSLIAVTGGMLIDRSFRFPIDIQYGLNLPVLAVIPDTRLPVKRMPVWKVFRRKKPVEHKEKPLKQTTHAEPVPLDNQETSAEKLELETDVMI